jgi:tetratricopeptide (TPR) repeat protein
MDAADVLAPLNDADSAVARLQRDPGASAAEATDPTADLTAVSAALEMTLRRWLRAEPGVAETLRRSALAADQLPFQDVIDELRRQGALSLELASRIHVLRAAVERGTSVAAPSADAAAMVQAVRAEVQARPPTAPVPPPPPPPSSAAPRRRAVSAAATVLVLVAALVAFLLLRPGGDYRRGVAAFARGDTAAAEQELQAVVARDSNNVTALLYLARMARRGGRYAEAAAELKRAVATSPSDADVRRELGHFFFDLGQYGDAADQFRRAVNLQPDEALNWIGLVRALRALGDSQADRVLQQAPAAVQAQVSGTP